MKKIILTLTLLAGITVAGFAQKTEKAKLSAGIDAGLIVGDVSDMANMAIGASLKYDLPVCSKTFFTFSAGYTYLPYTNDYKVELTALQPTQSGGEGYVPLKAGFKYLFCDNFYGEAQAGAAIPTAGGGVGFAYAPGVGIKLNESVDFGLRYEAWTKSSTVSQIALRLGFSF